MLQPSSQIFSNEIKDELFKPGRIPPILASFDNTFEKGESPLRGACDLSLFGSVTLCPSKDCILSRQSLSHPWK